jgi:type I restriction enzyme R subunit
MTDQPPNELRVDRETLEKEFLNLAEAQGVSDIEELNRVLEWAVTLRNMLKNRDRMTRLRIAEYVARHFREHIEPMGYKAFLVGVDREACARYKKLLDKHLPPEWSQVVYSPAHNDTAELAEYHLAETQEKKIRKAFRDPEGLPKILIVTEKLLTGFDAPILYCVYLDKPMRDHVLLQAIARVNRPYEDETGRKKPSGFVLDFVGIFENLEKALAYDSADVAGVVHDIAVLKEHFAGLMERSRSEYLPLTEGKKRDKAVEAVLDHFRDEERRQEFYRFFREVADIYEILSPDAFLRPYVDEYETLARMYRILREAYEPGVLVDRELARKTARLVQERTQSGAIIPALDIYEINESALKKIEESKASDTEKVFNLLKSILKTIQENAAREPYLISIGERAEQIAALYKERQNTTQKALGSLRELIREINAARKQQTERDMPPEVFAVFWLLRREGLEKAEDVANLMTDVLKTNPHWKTSERHERNVKQALYRNLLKGGLSDDARLADVSGRIMKAPKGGRE